MKISAILTLWATAAWLSPGFADWTDARCDIYPAGQDHTDIMIPCTFGQRQGYITLTRDDGTATEWVARTSSRSSDTARLYRNTRRGGLLHVTVMKPPVMANVGLGAVPGQRVVQRYAAYYRSDSRFRPK